MNIVYYIKDVLRSKRLKSGKSLAKPVFSLVVAFVLIMGWSSSLFARELVTASWEQAEEEKLWDEQVAGQWNRIFSDNEKRFRVSALNSAEFISRIHEEIRTDKKALAADADMKKLSTEKTVELLRFKRNLSISITEPYTNERIEDLDFIPKIPVLLLQQKNLCSAPRPEELLSGYGLLALTPGPFGGNTGSKKTSKAYNSPWGEHIDTHAVNLREYSLEHNKANYYELILYLWEDSPWHICGKALFPSVLRLSAERQFHHYYLFPINTITSSITSNDLQGGLA